MRKTLMVAGIASLLAFGAPATAVTQEPEDVETTRVADGDDDAGKWGLVGLLGLAGLLGLKRRDSDRDYVAKRTEPR